MKTIYEIGCYADGARGDAEQNDIVIDLIDQMPNGMISESAKRAIVGEYRAYVLLLESDADADAIHDAHQAIHETIESAVELLNEATDPSNYEDARPPFSFWDWTENGDFGLWAAVYLVEHHARYESDVVSADDAPDFIMDVNDHGNMTLYAIERREVWSVV
ncbi:hypothetical protein [uncultured Mediterranean phage uvDeep-CGR2-KM24-C26]|nr:hypothetical protein [uncultured Mediterranean phage uvDeep-CGR2-KM24-C26]